VVENNQNRFPGLRGYTTKICEGTTNKILSHAFAETDTERVPNAETGRSMHGGVCEQVHKIIEVFLGVCGNRSCEYVKV